MQDALVQVHVGPPQTQQLAPPHPQPNTDREQRVETGPHEHSSSVKVVTRGQRLSFLLIAAVIAVVAVVVLSSGGDDPESGERAAATATATPGANDTDAGAEATATP